MSVVDTVMSRLPPRLRALAQQHHEMLKFAVVGGTTFIIDQAIFYWLKLTILNEKVTTAKIIATLVATIVSYVLNREWSFRTRGGRERHHEAALFFIVSGIGVGITATPLFFARNVFHLRVPEVSLLVQEVSDFAFGVVLGTLLAMIFRWWAFRKWVFPNTDVRPPRGSVPQEDLVTEELGHS
ncbi:sugar translocase [Longimycelium tulufanense]|uniref:Sugar translocase n=1 Tax=Longimycelium tulufanense TaxID=907463 RepID=A0A8J3CAQ9_9PSEU|nr:GtrA family protein [Longimycelium tulufanense]GGM66202.1 sugar translocase [Longimycelium tulufanense]